MGNARGWIGRRYIIWRGSSRPQGSPPCFHLRHNYPPFPSASFFSLYLSNKGALYLAKHSGQVSRSILMTCHSWILFYFYVLFRTPVCDLMLTMAVSPHLDGTKPEKLSSGLALKCIETLRK